jgi:thiosulfate/3-mercaptopyruvate sulfurtransferase
MDDRPSRVSTQDLRALVDDAQVQIIDVRPIDAYNGWRMRGEARGGHIPGARTLPARWSTYMDWIEIVRAKGIEPDKPVVVYGCDAGETEQVARLFQRAGYRSVRIYHDFAEEWSGDAVLPMERLPRYRHLVSPSWLKGLLDEGTAPELENDRYVLCHAHYRNPDAYREGHIPGAVPVDTNTLESPETWNRRSPAEVRQALEKLGITADTTVVLYGRFSFPDNADPFPGSSAGHLGAFRCAFIMMWAGVKDVRMLNGGLQAWTDAGYQVTTEETEPQPVADFGVRVPAHPGLAVDLPEAKEILASPDANLVSVRSWPEYIGEVSGYNYIEKKGRIPGSVYGDCGSDAYHMENYRNLDHTTREYGEVEAAWARVGVTTGKHNAFYCGTGWRGSEAFFNAWLLGWPRVSVYDGGWFEWSNDPANPIETGVPGEEAGGS